MKRGYLWLILAVLALCVAGSGCSVVDDSSSSALQRLIADHFIHDELRSWAMRKAAVRELVKAVRGQGNDKYRIAHMECRQRQFGKWGDWVEQIQMEDPPGPGEDPADFAGGNLFDVLAREMLSYLIGDGIDEPGHTYPEIIEKLSERVSRREAELNRQTALKTQCRYIYAPGFAPDEMPKEAMDPSDDDIEKELLRSPLADVPSNVAAALIGAGIVGAGAPVVVPLLCPLDDGAPCPTDPRYSPGATPQPDQGAP